MEKMTAQRSRPRTRKRRTRRRRRRRKRRRRRRRRKRRKRRRRRRNITHIKSNKSHLTGGEFIFLIKYLKNNFIFMNFIINRIFQKYILSKILQMHPKYLLHFYPKSKSSKKNYTPKSSKLKFSKIQFQILHDSIPNFRKNLTKH